MMLKRNNFLFYFSVLISFTLTAQENPTAESDTVSTKVLEEVIVTATRTVRQLSSLPLPAQIIGKQEIQQINAQRLSDLLNEQTGLITVPDFDGGEGIQLQGLDAEYTLILIDGVPLIGRSAGTLDINRITVGNIKQIEVVKGASSSLYGSEALGGVINIITEKPGQALNGNINHRIATFNTHDTGATIAYGKNKAAVSAFVNRFSSNGYDLDKNDALNTVDPYTNYTFDAKFHYDITKTLALSVFGRYFIQNQDYIASDTLKGESDSNEWNSHLKLSYSANPRWKSHFELYATRYNATAYLNNPDNTRFSESNFNQFLLRPEIRTTYSPNKKHTFIAGLGGNRETLKRTDFLTQPKFNSYYLYLQYDANPDEKINIIFGTRFDYHSEYASQFSPKIAISYRPNAKITVKGAVGYGFKAPDFRQLYFNFTNATIGYTVLGYNAVATTIPKLEAEGQLTNINVPLSAFEDALKPENSIAVNIGVDYRPVPELTFHINAFQNHIKDLIDTRVIATKTNGQNVFSYYNTNKVYTQGIEWSASWKPSNRLRISGGYQLLFARDKAAEKAFENGEIFAKENPASPTFQLKKGDYFGLYNRSRHMANIKVFYTIPKWKCNANIRATYRSKYGLFDSNGNSYLDRYDEFVNGYTIWDFAVNKTFYKNYLLGFGIDNVFNFTDIQNISNIPGQIIYGKFTMQF